MKQSDTYRANAHNCAEMAAAADNEPARNRFKRMETAWLALAGRRGLARWRGFAEN